MAGGHDANLKYAIGVVLAVIGAIIAMTAMAGQAPTVATLTNTATGTALANAGITSTTLAGTVYSFVNVFWAIGILLLPFLVIGVVVLHGKGYV